MRDDAKKKKKRKIKKRINPENLRPAFPEKIDFAFSLLAKCVMSVNLAKIYHL